MSTTKRTTHPAETREAAWKVILLSLANDSDLERSRWVHCAHFGEEVANALPAEVARIRADIESLLENDMYELEEAIRLGRI